MPKILIWGEALAGSGHIKTVANLAKAFSDKGTAVMVASGSLHQGRNFDFGTADSVDLPSIYYHKDKGSYTDNNLPLAEDKDWLERRKIALVNLAQNFKPDIIVLELWPIGRTLFNDEILSMLTSLHAAHFKSPITVSVIRDVIFMRNTASAEPLMTLINRHLNEIVIRGDGKIKLEESLPEVQAVKCNIHYLGHFTSSPSFYRDGSRPDNVREVLVSAGEGFTQQGMNLFVDTLHAYPHTRLNKRPWRLLVGNSYDQEHFDTICKLAEEMGGNNITVTRTTREFPQLLANCYLSVSQGGYNTSIELAQTASLGVKSLVVPIIDDDMTNNEQLFRINHLKDEGYICGIISPNACKDAKTMAAHMDACSQHSLLPKEPLKVDGAENTADFLLKKLKDRSNPAPLISIR